MDFKGLGGGRRDERMRGMGNERSRGNAGTYILSKPVAIGFQGVEQGRSMPVVHSVGVCGGWTEMSNSFSLREEEGLSKCHPLR